MKVIFASLTMVITVLQCCLQPVVLLMVRNPLFRETQFAVHLSHELAVKPLRIYQVRDAFQCAYKCIEHEQCLSFNMAVNFTGRLKLCQLLSADKAKNFPYFRHSMKFHFYGIVQSLVQQNESESKAVQNGEWTKLNSNPVHVESKGNKYGKFNSIQSGQILKFKFVYVSGGMSCWITEPGYGITKFGCGPNLAVIITNTSNKIISPNASYVTQYSNYNLPGVSSNDSEITLPEIDPPLQVTAGQEFRLWYGEDLTDSYEDDNVGTLDVDVYAFYK